MSRREIALRLIALDAEKWIASADGGVAGSTLAALEDRGLVEVRWSEKPYRRMEGRLTPAGVRFLRDWHAAELHRLERIISGPDSPAVEVELEQELHDDIELVDGMLRAAVDHPVGRGPAKLALAAFDRLEGRLR